jgi:hypothetical protein
MPVARAGRAIGSRRQGAALIKIGENAMFAEKFMRSTRLTSPETIWGAIRELLSVSDLPKPTEQGTASSESDATGSTAAAASVSTVPEGLQNEVTIILNETQRISWQLIWECEMKDRYRSATIPPPEISPEAKTDAAPSTTEISQDPERSQNHQPASDNSPSK